MRWEYATLKLETEGWVGGKVDHPELVQRLNHMGELGWELVSAFNTTQSYGASREIVAIFKRPKT